MVEKNRRFQEKEIDSYFIRPLGRGTDEVIWLVCKEVDTMLKKCFNDNDQAHAGSLNWRSVIKNPQKPWFRQLIKSVASF